MAKGETAAKRRATEPRRKSVKASERQVPASQAVRDEWARRVEAEYRSAAITQHLTLWLIQIGASPDLIHDGLRIVTDELAHAELSHATFLAAGGSGMQPIARDSLQLRVRRDEPLESAVARYGVEIFCLGETVAVPLFRVLREECTVPAARTALDRVLKDEVRHRDFGWTLLEHLLDLGAASLVREVLAAELPAMFARLRRNYAPVGGEQKHDIPADDRAWGLMPIARYGEIVERTLERDYRPRFERLGIAVDEAWQRACELHPTIG
jgi:hypothetical protein